MSNWRRFFSQKQILLGLMIILAFAGVALAAPSLSPPDEDGGSDAYKLVGRRFDYLPNPPSEEHPLGTTLRRDEMAINLPQTGLAPPPQMDMYHTLIWGARSAFRIGLTITILTASFGVFVGLVSGYVGGLANGLLMRITDAFLAFPAIAGVWLFDRAIFSQISVSAFFDQAPEPSLLQGIQNALGLDSIMLALIVFSWMPYARLINTTVSQLKKVDFVLAAQALGASGPRIVFRHLLPNAIAPAIVLAARDVGSMVIMVSAFSFIGLGGTAAWGVILLGGRDFIIGVGGNPFAYWWVFLPVALALILFGVGWNLLGDGINTFLNPRAARRR